MNAALVALALGLATMGTPAVTLGQGKAPPPPGGQPAPPPRESVQPAPPPPGGAQPPPGYAPYPYPPPQYTHPGYPPPYGYPGYGPSPDTLPYKSNQPVPPGYKVQERARTGLIVAGSVILGIFYIFTISATIKDFDSSRAPYPALVVPVLGPFIVGAAGNFRQSGTEILYFANGFVQAGSAAMLLAGIFAKKKILVRQDLVEEAYKPQFLVGPGSVGMKLAF